MWICNGSNGNCLGHCGSKHYLPHAKNRGSGRCNLLEKEVHDIYILEVKHDNSMLHMRMERV